jgi:hypothetical protein
MSGEECRLPLVKVQFSHLPDSTMVKFSSFVALDKNEFYTANISNQPLPISVIVAQSYFNFLDLSDIFMTPFSNSQKTLKLCHFNKLNLYKLDPVLFTKASKFI